MTNGTLEITFIVKYGDMGYYLSKGLVKRYRLKRDGTDWIRISNEFGDVGFDNHLVRNYPELSVYNEIILSADPSIDLDYFKPLCNGRKEEYTHKDVEFLAESLDYYLTQVLPNSEIEVRVA